MKKRYDALFGSRDEQVEAILQHDGECKIAGDTCRNVDFFIGFLSVRDVKPGIIRCIVNLSAIYERNEGGRNNRR